MRKLLALTRVGKACQSAVSRRLNGREHDPEQWKLLFGKDLESVAEERWWSQGAMQTAARFEGWARLPGASSATVCACSPVTARPQLLRRCSPSLSPCRCYFGRY